MIYLFIAFVGGQNEVSRSEQIENTEKKSDFNSLVVSDNKIEQVRLIPNALFCVNKKHQKPLLK